jgi:hypothetical protein
LLQQGKHTTKGYTVSVYASDKVEKFVNKRTRFGSPENNIQILVRKAYRATKAEVHGQIDPGWALGLRRAVEVVTGGDLAAVDVQAAVLYDENIK